MQLLQMGHFTTILRRDSSDSIMPHGMNFHARRIEQPIENTEPRAWKNHKLACQMTADFLRKCSITFTNWCDHLGGRLHEPCLNLGPKSPVSIKTPFVKVLRTLALESLSLGAEASAWQHL